MLSGKKESHAGERGQGSVGIDVQYTTATSSALHAFVRSTKTPANSGGFCLARRNSGRVWQLFPGITGPNKTAGMAGTLPEPFAGWFAAQGWTPRRHQLEMLDAAAASESVLLIAPTGGGKTLAGFLPTLVALTAQPHGGLHTLYISPLKALATDVARNLLRPVHEMQLPVSIETRTGDTPTNRRARQREAPPHILLTTPESLAVLLTLPDAPALFAGLRTVVMDEVHALAGTKRGDQLSLCMSRLMTLASACRRVGLSATVAHPAVAGECHHLLSQCSNDDRWELADAFDGTQPLDKGACVAEWLADCHAHALVTRCMRDTDAKPEAAARGLVHEGGALREVQHGARVDRRNGGAERNAFSVPAHCLALRHVAVHAGRVDTGVAAAFDIAGNLECLTAAARYGDE